MSTATMHTSAGPIQLELFDEDAPKTVENFRKLSTDGFYDGLAADHTLTWTDQVLEAPLATAGVISDFSSFGTDAELGLKPDLGGPGGQIYSTWPHQQFGGHNTISGTSMAAPHIAGLAALILQAKHQNIALRAAAGLPAFDEPAGLPVAG